MSTPSQRRCCNIILKGGLIYKVKVEAIPHQRTLTPVPGTVAVPESTAFLNLARQRKVAARESQPGAGSCQGEYAAHLVQ